MSLGLTSIESMMLSNHLVLCHPLLLLPSIFPSIRIFSNKLVLFIRWPKYWSFSVSPSNKYSGLISSRTDWFGLLAAQGTLKSLLQHHSSESINSVLCLRYGPTLTSIHDCWKKYSFTIQTFVSKVISLLFNILSRFVTYGNHLIWSIYFADDNI